MAGLYLHIPFCRRKCPYCDFYSEVACEATLQSYPDLLKQQLALVVEQGWPGPVDSIYFGGGTPTLLTPKAISGILQASKQSLGWAKDVEITLEANPGTVTEQSLTGYRQAGVNRLSLGLQSCNNKHLAHLGRLHNRQDGLDSFRWARSAGFDSISLDLMFALPDQTTAELEDDLYSYLDLSPEHLSCYGLTAEPETPFQQKIISGEMTLPDEDFYVDAFMMIHERLTHAGYDHYEIANYARKDHACRHNLGYWQRHACLGIGAGAHSFHVDQWGQRRAVPSDLATYRQALHVKREPTRLLETFDRESALHETIYLALRTQKGISDIELQQRFGCTLQEAFPEAIEASAQWLTKNNDHWSLSPSGWLIFDRLILPFL